MKPQQAALEAAETYTIIPGIASIVSIRREDGFTLVAIYMGPDPLPAVGDGRFGRVRYEGARSSAPYPEDAIPTKVRAAVNRHFGTVFSLPVERRQQYLDGVGKIAIVVDN